MYVVVLTVFTFTWRFHPESRLFLHGASINKLLISFKDFYGKSYCSSIAVSERGRREGKRERARGGREGWMYRRQTRLKDTDPGVIVFRCPGPDKNATIPIGAAVHRRLASGYESLVPHYIM